ncbi:radical SAM protein [Candidatus Auribacterota bacterium]
MTTKTPAYPLNCIYYYPTESCNLKCKHCWIAPNFSQKSSSDTYLSQNENNLTFDELRDVIEDATTVGLNSIKITGGEPFLHPDIMKYIHFFADKNLRISIETNGTLLDKAAIVDLKKLNCLTSVSLDGSAPSSHDRIRGIEGSFSKALRTIELMAKHNMPIEIIFSLLKENQGELPDLIEHLNRFKVPVTLKINMISPIGRAMNLKDTDNELEIGSILELNRRITEEYEEKYPNVKIFLHIPVAFRPVGKILRDISTFCRIFNIIGLLSDGKLSYCGIGRLEEELILGNVRKDRLSDIWTRSEELRVFREKMPAELKGICSKCIHKHQCLGSCVAQTYTLKRDLFGPFAFCDTAHRMGFFPASRIR